MSKRRRVLPGGRPSQLLTSSQVADTLGLSYRHLLRLKEAGKLIPAFRVHIKRVGTVDLFTPEQIAEYGQKTKRAVLSAPFYRGANPSLRERRRRMNERG